MTDLEISKALALAIGWESVRTDSPGHHCLVWDERVECLRRFDYRDWNVIAPIAERYGCFPVRSANRPEMWMAMQTRLLTYAETPQKAIALTVIKGAKQ